MDIFNKNRINEMSFLIKKKDEKINELEKSISNLKKELNLRLDKVQSLLKENEELSIKKQNMHSNNLIISSELSLLKKKIGD